MLLLVKIPLLALFTMYMLLAAVWPVGDKGTSPIHKGLCFIVWVFVMYWVLK